MKESTQEPAVETATQEEAEKLVASGEAEVPQEAIVPPTVDTGPAADAPKSGSKKSAKKTAKPSEAVRQVVMVVPLVNMTLPGGIHMVAGEKVEIPVEEYERLALDARGPFFKE